MNVSQEADSVFMRLLEKEAPKRSADLEKNMRPAPHGGWIVGICSRCGKNILDAPFLSRDEAGEFCSRDCRDASVDGLPKTGRPKGTKDRSFIRRPNKVYASAADRTRAWRERKVQVVSVTE